MFPNNDIAFFFYKVVLLVNLKKAKYDYEI